MKNRCNEQQIIGFLKPAATGLSVDTPGRYYDASFGRFINQDPIGLSGGDNLYQFAPNANKYIDPLGHFFFIPILIGMAIGAAGGIAAETALQILPNVSKAWKEKDAIKLFDCLHYDEIALSGITGAITGSLGAGAFKAFSKCWKYFKHIKKSPKPSKYPKGYTPNKKQLQKKARQIKRYNQQKNELGEDAKTQITKSALLGGGAAIAKNRYKNIADNDCE